MTARRACRFVLAAFCLLYLVAIVLFVIGTYGLLGSASGPLAGIYLVLLGLPWSRLLDAVPEPARILTAVLAPAINAGILVVLCRGGRLR